MSIPDQVNHELNLAEVTGTQKCSDEKWNNAAVTYSGLLPNLSRAQGRQRGYFINDHGADGRDWGTFDGKVTTSDAEISIEGSWQFIGGGGKFKDLWQRHIQEQNHVAQSRGNFLAGHIRARHCCKDGEGALIHLENTGDITR